eukprot:1350507-Prymnesium_polylepis.1
MRNGCQAATTRTRQRRDEYSAERRRLVASRVRSHSGVSCKGRPGRGRPNARPAAGRPSPPPAAGPLSPTPCSWAGRAAAGRAANLDERLVAHAVERRRDLAQLGLGAHNDVLGRVLGAVALRLARLFCREQVSQPSSSQPERRRDLSQRWEGRSHAGKEHGMA